MNDKLWSLLTASKKTIRFRYALLDKNLQYKRDINTIENASVEFNSENAIKRTAKFTMQDAPIDYLSSRIKIYMEIKESTFKKWNEAAKKKWGEISNKKWTHEKVKWMSYPLGVFVLSSPEKKSIGNKIERNIEAYDLNQILQTTDIGNRLYYQQGVCYTDVILDLLKRAGYTIINVEKSEKTLKNSIEFSPQKKYLEVINELLIAIGYSEIYPDENGIFTAKPQKINYNKNDIDFIYTTKNQSIICDGAMERCDYFNVPNKFIAIVSDENREMTATWENKDEMSELSTINRQTITENINVKDISDQKTLNEFVEKYGKEKSNIYGDIDFQTTLVPQHGYKNILQFTHETLNINGYFEEKIWQMDLTTGGNMRHIARRI